MCGGVCARVCVCVCVCVCVGHILVFLLYHTPIEFMTSGNHMSL